MVSLDEMCRGQFSMESPNIETFNIETSNIVADMRRSHNTCKHFAD